MCEPNVIQLKKKKSLYQLFWKGKYTVLIRYSWQLWLSLYIQIKALTLEDYAAINESLIAAFEFFFIPNVLKRLFKTRFSFCNLSAPGPFQLHVLFIACTVSSNLLSAPLIHDVLSLCMKFWTHIFLPKIVEWGWIEIPVHKYTLTQIQFLHNIQGKLDWYIQS